MPKKLTAHARATRWFNRQTRAGNLRNADYSALSKRMALCYEPAVLLARRNEQSLHDTLQIAKQLKAITDFKL